MRQYRPTWALITGLTGAVCIAVLIAVGGTYPMVIGVGLATIAGVLAVAEQERADRAVGPTLYDAHTLRETGHVLLAGIDADCGGDLEDRVYEFWLDRPDGRIVYGVLRYVDAGTLQTEWPDA